MKNITSTLLFVLLLSTTSYSQSSTSKADSLMAIGEMKEAKAEYYKQFLLDPNNRSNTYNYASALALTRNTDSAFFYLNLAIANDSGVMALTDPDLFHLIDDARWAQLEDSLLIRVEARHGKYPKVELSKELWRMKIRDQAYYYHISLANKKLEDASVLTSALWQMKHKLNEQNLRRLTEIIDSSGWPKKSLVKGSAAGAAFLIVQHSDLATQQKYLPLMEAAATNGEASWSSLALLIDRVNLREGKEQIYGSQVYQNEDGSFYVKDLLEPEYVDQRRREVGLRPISSYVKMWDIIWDIPQKEK
jgi:hypothetical protein